MVAERCYRRLGSLVASALWLLEELPICLSWEAIWAWNLVNTVEPRFETADRREHLVDPDALLVWAQRVQLVSDPAAGSIRTAWSKAPRAAVRALHEVIEIREALYAVLRFHLVGETRRSESPDGELEFLAQRYAAALGRSELRLQTRSARRIRAQVPVHQPELQAVLRSLPPDS